MSKMFIPITKAQKSVNKSLLGELKPMRKNLKELPEALTFHRAIMPAAPDDKDEDEDEDVMRCNDKVLKLFGRRVGLCVEWSDVNGVQVCCK